MENGTPRILIVRLSALGDCIHALPVLSALRLTFPDAFLGWAIESGSHYLLRDHPQADRFHVFPRKAFHASWLEGFRALNAFRKELRAARYDIVLDLQGLTKSGLVARLSGASRRAGFRGPESRELNCLFLSERLAAPAEATHVVEKNLSLLRALRVEPSAPRWVFPEYREEKERMDLFLAKCGLQHDGHVLPFAIVNTGGTWPTKRWAVSRFAETAKALRSRLNLPVVALWGSAAEKVEAAEVVRCAEAFLAPPTDLRQLAALCSRAALFVGNDTGPLHLAAALGVPTTAIFGASDAQRNGPFGRHTKTCVAATLDCRPCWRDDCSRRDKACLEQVSVEAVLDACERLWAETAADRAGERT